MMSKGLEVGNDGCKIFMAIIVFGCFAGTCYCIFIMLSFFVYYVFAGFAVGVWFQFGNVYYSGQYLVPEALGVSVFVVIAIVDAITGNAVNGNVPIAAEG